MFVQNNSVVKNNLIVLKKSRYGQPKKERKNTPIIISLQIVTEKKPKKLIDWKLCIFPIYVTKIYAKESHLVKLYQTLTFSI